MSTTGSVFGVGFPVAVSFSLSCPLWRAFAGSRSTNVVVPVPLCFVQRATIFPFAPAAAAAPALEMSA